MTPFNNQFRLLVIVHYHWTTRKWRVYLIRGHTLMTSPNRGGGGGGGYAGFKIFLDEFVEGDGDTFRHPH